MVVGTVTFGMALTPSLLPRPWLFEGVIAGLGFALGYGLGNVGSWFLRGPMKVIEPTARFKHWAWRGLAVLGPLAALYFLLLGVGWQNEVRTLVGMEDEGLVVAAQVLVVAVPIALLAILAGRGLRRLNRRVGADPQPLAADVGLLRPVRRGRGAARWSDW